MSFTLAEITNKTVATRPETGLHGLNANGSPYLFGAERNISYGWNWLGDTETEIWNNRNMSHYAFGSVCVGRNQELYYVFRKGFDHGVSVDPESPYYQIGGDLYYTVSYDFGETWADPVMFLEHTTGRDLRDVTLSYYDDHDMYVLIYEDCSIDYSEHSGVLHIMSTPNLARPRSSHHILDPFPITNMSDWTLPTSNMFAELNQTFSRLIPLGSYFFLPFYGTDDGTNFGAGVIRFTRGVYDNPSGEVLKKWDADGSNECTFYTTCDGTGIIRFNVLFRGGGDNSTGDNAMISYSDDYGATWSEKQELGFNAAGGPQVFDLNGIYMLVARDQKNSVINYTYAMFSKDGQHWGNRIPLSCNGTSYASIAQLNSGKTLLFYSKELNKSIICMREVYGVPTIPDVIE